MDAEERTGIQEIYKKIVWGYSVGDLKKAFTKVQNKKNWKNPIEAIILTCDVPITVKAIAFFAGSRTEVVKMSNGQSKIIAPGYYLSIGA